MKYMNTTKTKIITSVLLLITTGFQSLITPVQAATQESAYTEVQLVATAYYSPLPNQSFYLRGSYEGDLRLNGNGTNGASGKEVFIGMIAAPKTYGFGTKIWIEGLGVGSVEDRGGAIVPAGQRGYVHDRVDIWMGSGEAGLRRALKWGKRTVRARVYEDDAPAVVAFDFSGIKIDSAIPSASKTQPTVAPIQKEEKDELDIKLAAFAAEEAKVRQKFEAVDMPKVGESSKDIRLLQEVLIGLGYFDRPSTGIFGEYTVNAIAKFQMDHKLVKDEKDPNAGKFGKITREKLVYETLFAGIDLEQIEK
ncbi:MAG: peptidoglycan-binding protein [Patescibacteria group bacterium]